MLKCLFEKNHLNAFQLQAMIDDFWRTPLDNIVDKYQLSDHSHDFGFKYVKHMSFDNINVGYAYLKLFKQMAGLKFLVTSGFETFQKFKIKGLELELEHEFDDVFLTTLAHHHAKVSNYIFYE